MRGKLIAQLQNVNRDFRNFHDLTLKKTRQSRICSKIHVTRQFFEGSSRHSDLIEKTKNRFLNKVNGSMCAKVQVCIVVSVARRRDTNTQINT